MIFLDTSCLMPGDQCYVLCQASFVLESSEELTCSESACLFENSVCNNQDVCSYCFNGNLLNIYDF